MNKTVWIRADKEEDMASRKRILTTSLENNFLRIAIRDEDRESFEKIGMFEPIHIGPEMITIGDEKGIMANISDKESEKEVAKLTGEVDFVVVGVENWKVIPLENLIAAFQSSRTKLIVRVSDPDEAGLFFGTLEVGVDGILLEPEGPEQIIRLRRIIDEGQMDHFSMVDARILEIRPLGIGDRVCIDTCSLLGIGEGMLIGSQSSGLFLVHSESVGSEYVGTRPFRVNAGPVQSYVMSPGDRIPYLSDLRVGDEVLSVDGNGSTRPVIIGRLKIERRPLVLITADHDGECYSIILQNAETVRLVRGNDPVSLVDLKVGDEVKMMVGEGGRHFGTRVIESSIER